MASRVVKAIGPAVLAFAVYIIYTGSAHIYDIVTGAVVAAVVGALTANLTIANPSKLIDLRRYLWLVAYALHYFFIDEVKAHLDVMYRILHPSMPIKPGIVRVKYDVQTDYAVTAVANSITNTPGTVVVDIDPEKNLYYVHWINVKGVEPEVTKEICKGFEYFASKVFD